jgi:WD40-like Beta Propeller Repeat
VKFGPEPGPNGAGDMALAPDESYLVMTPTRPGGPGRGDVHVSFRRADGSWTDLVRLDDTINTPDHEWCPMLTGDGKYLFFSRLAGTAGPPWAPGTIADVYWVDARILDQYRPPARVAD